MDCLNIFSWNLGEVVRKVSCQKEEDDIDCSCKEAADGDCCEEVVGAEGEEGLEGGVVCLFTLSAPSWSNVGFMDDYTDLCDMNSRFQDISNPKTGLFGSDEEIENLEVERPESPPDADEGE